MDMPPIVSPQEWEAARQELLVKEKELTRARDALAAERRRMPRMAVEKEYRFEGMARNQRLLPRRRRHLPHLLRQRPRRRGDGEHLELPRPDRSRAAGGVGGLPGGLPADPALPVVEPPRRVRQAERTGLIAEEAG